MTGAVSGPPNLVSTVSSKLSESIDYISMIHIARRIDVDGFNADAGAARTRNNTFGPSAKLGKSFGKWERPFRRYTMRAL